jgi:hypothetical protein
MSDVATLGLAIDSTQAVAASKALDDLTASAKPAATAAAALETAAADASTALNTSSTAATNAGHAHAGMSTQAMAAMHSIRSMAEEIALGIPPTQVLTQQMAHLSFAASGPGGLKGAFTEALTALRGFINPTTLVVGGLAAIAGAAVITYNNIAATEKQFDSLSDHAMTSVDALHSLQQATQIKGVAQPDFLKSMDAFAASTAQARENTGSLATLLRANGDAAGTLEQNLMNVADLVKNTTSEAQKYQIIQQAGLPATYQWVQFLSQGSAGIKAATDAAVKYGDVAEQTFIQTAKDATETWTKFFSSIENGSRSAFIGATNYATGFIQSLDNIGFKIAQKFGPGAAQTYASGVFRTAKDNGSGTAFGPDTDFSQFYKATGAPNNAGGAGPKTTVDPTVQARQASQYSAVVSALGPLATVTQQVTARQLELNSAANSNPLLTSSAIAKITAYTEAQAIGVVAIQQQTSAEKINADTLNLGVGAAAAYRSEQERLADFQLRGITLTQQQSAALHDAATAYGQAAQAAATLKVQVDTQFQSALLGMSDTEAKVAEQARQLWGSDYPAHINDSISAQIRLNDTLGQFKTTGQTVLTGIAEDFRDGKSAATVFGNALVTIENKLIDMASNQLISGFISSISGLGFGGGGFNFFGSSVAGAGKGLSSLAAGVNHTGYGPGDSMPMRFVHPAYFENAPRFHTGIGPGERAAVIRNDESVLTPGQMSQLAPAGKAGSNGGPITVNINNAPAGTTATATQSKDGTGGMRLDVWLSRQVDDTAAASVDSGNSSLNASLERRYGLSPRL